MPFNTKSFSARTHYMGDTAEEKFTEYCALNGWTCVDFGWNRPELNLFWKLPLVIKYMPDKLVEAETHFLTEVKGVGKDQIIKLKSDNLSVLWYWHKILPVKIFIYDSTNRCATIIDLPSLPTLTSREQKKYEDNAKPYYLFNTDEFSWTTL